MRGQWDKKGFHFTWPNRSGPPPYANRYVDRRQLWCDDGGLCTRTLRVVFLHLLLALASSIWSYLGSGVCFDFETNDDTRYELLMMIDIFGRGVKLIRRNCILWWWWYDGAKCRVGLARFRLWRYGHLIYKRSLLRCGCGLIVIFIMYVWFRSTEER